MVGRNVTDTRVRDDPSAHHRIAEHYVGHRIRIDDPRGWNSGWWAQITMVIPSRSGLCWLVEYSNGCTDVVRIYDNPLRFHLAP